MELADFVAALASQHDLRECVLLRACFDHYLYSLDLEFDQIWSPIGDVRGDIHQTLQPVLIRLEGIHRFALDGGLSDRMVECPNEMDWGLNEVALVRASERGPLNSRVTGSTTVALEVQWEGARRIEVECARASLRMLPARPRRS